MYASVFTTSGSSLCDTAEVRTQGESPDYVCNVFAFRIVVHRKERIWHTHSHSTHSVGTQASPRALFSLLLVLL